jgi:hypothetical protein
MAMCCKMSCWSMATYCTARDLLVQGYLLQDILLEHG